jgi:hypothetical protein
MDRILAEKNLSKKNFPSIELVFESAKKATATASGIISEQRRLADFYWFKVCR